MDESRFDAIVRSLGTLATRRLTLGALVAATLGVRGLDEAEAATSGKCDPKCGPCATCNKGKCKKKNGKKKCKKGKCEPKTDGIACTLSTGNGTCQAGKCCLGLEQTCTSGDQCCSNTLCGHVVSSTADRCCLPGLTPCSPATQSQCCTGICGAHPDTGQNVCFCKSPGDACDSDSQCCSGKCIANFGGSTCQ